MTAKNGESFIHSIVKPIPIRTSKRTKKHMGDTHPHIRHDANIQLLQVLFRLLLQGAIKDWKDVLACLHQHHLRIGLQARVELKYLGEQEI